MCHAPRLHFLFVVLLLTNPMQVLSQDAPIPWRSTHSSAAPTLDGVVEDLWSQAVPLDVTVREALGGGAAKVVTLRALHTDDSFYVLARWPDSTRSDQRDPYLWNPTSWQAPDFLDT